METKSAIKDRILLKGCGLFEIHLSKMPSEMRSTESERFWGHKYYDKSSMCVNFRTIRETYIFRKNWTIYETNDRIKKVIKAIGTMSVLKPVFVRTSDAKLIRKCFSLVYYFQQPAPSKWAMTLYHAHVIFKSIYSNLSSSRTAFQNLRNAKHYGAPALISQWCCMCLKAVYFAMDAWHSWLLTPMKL